MIQIEQNHLCFRLNQYIFELLCPTTTDSIIIKQERKGNPQNPIAFKSPLSYELKFISVALFIPLPQNRSDGTYAKWASPVSQQHAFKVAQLEWDNSP